MRDFRELKVWEKGHKLVLAIYAATRPFPTEERYGLTGQMRRAAAAIPMNIAEGCGRAGDAELRRFLLISMGSASELEYQLLLTRDLSYLQPDTYRQLNDQTLEVKRMLASFIKRLEK